MKRSGDVGPVLDGFRCAGGYVEERKPPRHRILDPKSRRMPPHPVRPHELARALSSTTEVANEFSGTRKNPHLAVLRLQHEHVLGIGEHPADPCQSVNRIVNASDRYATLERPLRYPARDLAGYRSDTERQRESEKQTPHDRGLGATARDSRKAVRIVFVICGGGGGLRGGGGGGG